MPCIAASAGSFPSHVVSQEDARRLAERIYAGHPRLLHLLKVFEVSGVRRRHFSFPAETYARDRSFEERNAEYVEAALALATDAARTCLARAATAPEGVDHVVLVTTTGLATPSLDARLAGRLGLRPDVRRWPVFGLGCAGGAGALIRAADLLRTAPRGRALVLAVEVCGQIFTPRATAPVDVVGAALFGDGAAAALVEREPGPPRGPRIAAARTRLFPGTEHLMGWRFTSDGMRLVLSPEVAEFVGERLKGAVHEFLAAEGLGPRDIRHWVLHPGGRRILEEYARAFGLGAEELELSTASLRDAGNVSSASALLILSDLLESGRARPGDRGLVVGLGPGFAAEMALLQW